MDTCRPEWSERLSAWFDGEAEAAEKRATEAHLQSCLPCRRVLQEWAALRGKLRGRAPEVRIPSAPRRRVRAWAAAVAVALVGASAMGALQLRARTTPLLDQLEQHHFQTFARASPCEFQSSDPRAVRAWLREKVGYDVEVPALAGATLLGARRCKLDGVLSASLQFRRGDSAVTLFIPPPHGRLPSRLAQLTDGSGHCTVGRLGERLCTSHEAQAIAVANADDRTLVAYADAVER